MTRSEIALLLGAIAARDQRTIGQADVLAWHEDLGDLDFTDARQAVTRHFRESTDRIMPAHIRRLTRVIRDERRASDTVRALPPGRFEDDPDRDTRIRRHAGELRQLLAELAERRSVPADGSAPEPTAHDRALARARAERRNGGRP